MKLSNEELARARQVGRGGLALSAAKIWFVVIGLLQSVAVTRLLGLETFGAIRGVLSPAGITYNPLVTTGIQGLSQAVNAREGGRRTPLAYALHATLGALVAALFWYLSPWIGGDLLRSPHLVRALRWVSGVILLYGLYAPLIGILNGRGKFLGQASLDMLAAVLRTTGLLVGGWLVLSTGKDPSFTPVDGAMAGFLVAAGIVLLSAVWLVVARGHESRAPAVPVQTPAEGKISWWPIAKKHLAFMGPVLVGQTLLNLLLQADTNTLRRFAGEAAAAREGLTGADVDTLVGAYASAQLFGFLPYQLLTGVSFILFPMLASAHASRDQLAIRKYVSTGVRLAMILVAIVVSVAASVPGPLLDLALGRAAALGADAMGILVFGLGAFAIFATLTTVLNSLERQWLSLLLTALAAALVMTLNVVFVRGQSFGPELLTRTASCTTAGLFAATAVTALTVRYTVGASVPIATLARVSAAIAVTVFTMRQLPAPSRALVPIYACAAAALCIFVLIATRELTRRDLEHARATFGRGPKLPPATD